ncbi:MULTISPECIES: response regulator transcription factor [Rhizobium]|uniref:response regulator transcription factor n=1 Tax=Rhizobium TaxID=379 RepID=UPI001959FCFD|nr:MULTISPECIES: response regulator transcription factor [Rhizobium]MBM7049003.1 response regulator transcription factor [Rhizobium lusitanum]
MRILIVEDDNKTANYLTRGLSESGYIVDRADDGETGLTQALEGIYDFLIVDKRLPGVDGLELVRRLREREFTLPILMISGLASTADRVEGLQAGCDDYLAKPYAFSELLARIEALHRRAARGREMGTLRVGDLELDLQLRRAARANRPITLQYREFLLLQTLMRHAGQIVTRSMLLEAAWNYDFEPRGNIIDMHIHRLRRKLDAGFDTQMIQTVPGAGYTIAAAIPKAT